MRAPVHTRFAAVAAAGVVFAGCAGSLGGAGARRYERAGLAALPLKRIDVAVSVAGPPASSEPDFDVPSFEPPQLDDPLRPGSEDDATQRRLARRVARRLQDAGFTVGLRYGGAGTSSVSTSSVASAPAAAERPLGPGQTVRDLMADSDADAILVVRVVPVDSFYVFPTREGDQVLDVTTGIVPQTAVRDDPEPRTGRLLVGQAFLFDRRTGARLWTRHLPDLPEDARIKQEDPFLAYGFVVAPGAPLPTAEERADRASKGFVTAMFADFPPPAAGTAEARAKLDAADLDSERRTQTFFDANRLAFEIGGNWTFQTAELPARFDNAILPDLETGFLAPSGAVRFEPRFGYIIAGGFSMSVGGHLGRGFSDAARTFAVINEQNDADSRGGTVTANGFSTFGVDGRVGWLLSLDADFFLWPTVGGYYERWAFDAVPAAIVPEPDADRGGALAEVDLVWRLGELGLDSWYTRVGGGLRVGAASPGGVTVGFEAGLSLGYFLSTH